MDGFIDCAAVEFEKWQALGNDYVIVEERRSRFELTPERIRALCAPGTGVCSRRHPAAVSERRRAWLPWPGCGSSIPMAPRPRCRATARARRSSTCTGEAGRRADTFSIQTAAGELRPTITSPTDVHGRHGPGSPAQRRLSVRERGRHAASYAGGRRWRFQHVQVGNPQCAIQLPELAELEALDLQAIGPEIEHHELFPNRTNVSWFTELAPGRIRARIFERGAGETSASGTGASGAAVAHVLDGGDSPVTVVLDGGELEVEVGEDLHITLTGWAVPVYRGALADDFLEELRCDRAKRLEQIPPYLFAELERKVSAKRAAGVDVISLGIGDPDTADVRADRRRGAARRRRSLDTTRTRATAGGRSSARRSPPSTPAASASTLDPETEVMPAIGAKECIFNLNLAFLDPGDVALAADPGYPGLHRRARCWPAPSRC